jgi:hypothetical protein
VNQGDIIAVLDWKSGKESGANREVVSYARAHGFLVEDGGEAPRSLVIAQDKVYLTRAFARRLRSWLDPNIVSPPGAVMVR